MIKAEHENDEGNRGEAGVSACCGAVLRVGGEGATHWYECVKCGKATDRATPAGISTQSPGESPGQLPDGVKIAHKWLKDGREEANGHISQWTTDEWNRYHTDLGLLIDFVTDCWQKDKP